MLSVQASWQVASWPCASFLELSVIAHMASRPLPDDAMILIYLQGPQLGALIGFARGCMKIASEMTIRPRMPAVLLRACRRTASRSDRGHTGRTNGGLRGHGLGETAPVRDTRTGLPGVAVVLVNPSVYQPTPCSNLLHDAARWRLHRQLDVATQACWQLATLLLAGS